MWQFSDRCRQIEELMIPSTTDLCEMSTFGHTSLCEWVYMEIKDDDFVLMIIDFTLRVQTLALPESSVHHLRVFKMKRNDLYISLTKYSLWAPCYELCH